LIDETQAAFGAHTPEESRSVVIRHKGALQFS